MKTEIEIKEKIGLLLSDHRLDKTATVIENATLALHQIDVEAKMRALLWVLGDTKRATLSELREQYP